MPQTGSPPSAEEQAQSAYHRLWFRAGVTADKLVFTPAGGVLAMAPWFAPAVQYERIDPPFTAPEDGIYRPARRPDGSWTFEPFPASDSAAGSDAIQALRRPAADSAVGRRLLPGRRDLRYLIQDAIEDWRDTDIYRHSESSLWDPDYTKELARFIRNRVMEARPVRDPGDDS